MINKQRKYIKNKYGYTFFNFDTPYYKKEASIVKISMYRYNKLCINIIGGVNFRNSCNQLKKWSFCVNSAQNQNILVTSLV